jgi:hypothetical protein
LLISLEAPNAPDLAEELAQRLLSKRLANDNFPLTSFEHHAILDITTADGDKSVDAIDADVEDWIMYKHSTLKKRRLPAKRQKQPSSKSGNEELVCIEIRR